MYEQIFQLHADALRALAHPKRLEIIHLLRDQELCVSDIYAMLDLPQANISQHLMHLRRAGMVDTRREGKLIYYRVSDERICKTCDLLREYLFSREGGSSYRYTDDVIDPVCGMHVTPKTAGFHRILDGKTYFFCASGCVKKFEAHKEQYA